VARRLGIQVMFRGEVRNPIFYSFLGNSQDDRFIGTKGTRLNSFNTHRGFAIKRQLNSEKARSSTPICTEQRLSSGDNCVSEIHSMLRTSWVAPNVYEFPDWVRLRRLPEVGVNGGAGGMNASKDSGGSY